jgi:LruC domain-containing protein
MINTYAYNTKGKTIEINVEPHFSLTTFRGSYMGGFNIVMHEPSSTNGKGQVIITPPHEGEAPQMICVPANWKWPKERVRIDNAYPGFTSWANKDEESKSEWGDLYQGGVWFKTQVDSKLLFNTFVSE